MDLDLDYYVSPLEMAHSRDGPDVELKGKARQESLFPFVFDRDNSALPGIGWFRLEADGSMPLFREVVGPEKLDEKSLDEASRDDSFRQELLGVDPWEQQFVVGKKLDELHLDPLVGDASEESFFRGPCELESLVEGLNAERKFREEEYAAKEVSSDDDFKEGPSEEDLLGVHMTEDPILFKSLQDSFKEYTSGREPVEGPLKERLFEKQFGKRMLLDKIPDETFTEVGEIKLFVFLSSFTWSSIVFCLSLHLGSNSNTFGGISEFEIMSSDEEYLLSKSFDSFKLEFL
ncbi:hypothetical protein ROZALSC1DRAFT_30866 [Rozella allomycis CSF55]|uniref:Uncharacterized protein n=1 Tax=Rozella allomycis (strain CSF55) TaxID=988480 RepID=A0A4P9YEH4_ROZAC|nr:hypothetical protein ROZALSC1DRAFT_30866 [Rozella allomycis CSF55]